MAFYYQTCLQEELASRVRRNQRYSLRSFARAIGIDAATLSRILNGQKIPSAALSNTIIQSLNLDARSEKMFLLSMAEAYEQTGAKRRSIEIKYLLKAFKLNPQEKDLTDDLFQVIADWHHYAILQAIRCEDFNPDPQAIAERFDLSVEEAQAAVRRLHDLGFIEPRGDTWVRTTPRLVTPDTRRSTVAQKRRFSQMLKRAHASMLRDPIEIRNHSFMTLAIDPEKLPLARQMIHQFMDDLCMALETRKKKVYELQVNLFPLEKQK